MSSNVSINLHSNEKVKKVHRLHQCLAHPSESSMMKLIKTGHFGTWKLNELDVKNAELEQCKGCLMGKMNSRVPPMSHASEEVLIGEHIHVDIVHVSCGDNQKEAFLVGVDRRTGFISSIQLKSKHSEQLIATMKGIGGFYKSLLWNTRVFHADRESTICSTSRELLQEGYQLEMVAPGVHEKFVERRIKSIREAVRACFYSAVIICKPEWNAYLFTFAIKGLNYTPNSKTLESYPRAMVTSKVKLEDIDDGRHISHAFGAYGWFHEPNTTNVQQTRAQDGIFLGSDFNTRAMKAYLLETGRIVTRNKFVEVPVTETVKERLNQFGIKVRIGYSSMDEEEMIKTELIEKVNDKNEQDRYQSVGTTLQRKYNHIEDDDYEKNKKSKIGIKVLIPR